MNPLPRPTSLLPCSPLFTIRTSRLPTPRPIVHALLRMAKIETFVIYVAANGCPIILNTSFPDIQITVDPNDTTPVNPRTFDENTTPMLSDDDESYTTSPDESLENNDTTQIEQFVENIGAIFILTPIYKAFGTFRARLLTFEKLEIDMKQDKVSLAEAGFLYMGDGQTDQMLCFFCGHSLRNWEDDDEPWAEHARWSPKCGFLLLYKGKRFVDEKCEERYIPKINQEELFKLIAGPRVASILENHNNTSRNDLVERTENNQVQQLLPDNTSDLSQQDPNAIPDHKLCKICYKREIKVALIPCGHINSCIQCAMMLNVCALCREPFSMIIRVHVIYMDGNLNQLPSSSSQCIDEPLNPMLCNVCHTNEMGVAFIPCRHVYACVECATKIHDCPICSKAICSIVKVYL